MDVLIIIGITIGASAIRIFIKKRSGNSEKLNYYNYSKYTIRHKKIGQSLNDQSKTTL